MNCKKSYGNSQYIKEKYVNLLVLANKSQILFEIFFFINLLISKQNLNSFHFLT